MKILVINPGFLPNPAVKGGAVENLTDMYLESNIFSDIEFVVYSRYDKKVDELKNINKNVEYRYIKKSSLIDEQFNRVLSKLSGYRIGNKYIKLILKDLIKRNEIEEFDYVLVENTYQYVISLSKVFKNKILLHQHNCLNIKDINVCKNAIEKSKNIYTVSEYVKKQIESISNKSHIDVLFNGIELDKFQKDADKELIGKFNIKENDLVFCYVGRVVREKGILELLEAFSKFEKINPNSKLLIIGSECFSNTSDEFLSKCKGIIDDLDEKVIFTGFIDYSKINQYYSLADIQVVPSRVDDSCPMAVIEGMSVGLAQIVTNSGGIPEEVTDKNAIIIDRNNLSDNIYNAMITITTDSKKLEQMKKESKIRSEKFSSEKYIATLYDYLKRLK